MPGRETFETVAGCKTRIMRGGQGAPLLFLHGAGGASLWMPFMETLAARFEVIVPEHPGFGGSESPEWLDNVGDVAYFYLDLIEQLGLKDIHLVGASLGGWIACEIAVRDDSVLASVTLVDPVGIRVKGVRKTDIFLLSPEETIRHLFHNKAMVEAQLARVQSEAEMDIAAQNRLTMAKLSWEPRLFNPHLYKWMHRIKAPTLVMWGENDRIVPKEYGPAFVELIPGSKLEVIPDCGHLPHVERPDEFVARIVAFAGGARR